jgi:hypothetical protein
VPTPQTVNNEIELNAHCFTIFAESRKIEGATAQLELTSIGNQASKRPSTTPVRPFKPEIWRTVPDSFCLAVVKLAPCPAQDSSIRPINRVRRVDSRPASRQSGILAGQTLPNARQPGLAGSGSDLTRFIETCRARPQLRHQQSRQPHCQDPSTEWKRTGAILHQLRGW